MGCLQLFLLLEGENNSEVFVCVLVLLGRRERNSYSGGPLSVWHISPDIAIIDEGWSGLRFASKYLQGCGSSPPR